jgi:hypothetical protein
MTYRSFLHTVALVIVQSSLLLFVLLSQTTRSDIIELERAVSSGKVWSLFQAAVIERLVWIQVGMLSS